VEGLTRPQLSVGRSGWRRVGVAGGQARAPGLVARGPSSAPADVAVDAPSPN